MSKVVNFPAVGLIGEAEMCADGVERLTVRTTRFAVPSVLPAEGGGSWVLDNPKMGNVFINNTVVYRLEKR